MKFSIVRIDSTKTLHLSVKTAEWFLERIQIDTKAGDISRFRDHILRFGSAETYDKSNQIARIYPSVEMLKAKNGNLEIVAFNGLINLHVGSLMTPEEREAVKEASKMLPMTFAAFEGVDGRSVDILVAIAQKGETQPQTESEMDSLCKAAYDVAYGVYSAALPKVVERQAVTARYSFWMTLDAKPYYNPQPTPLQVGSVVKVGQAAQLSQSEEQREVDMELYADYELMYSRAAEQALEETQGVIESQWYGAYITELARLLCKMGMPEEEAFLHIRNHHIYKKTYDENAFRTIVAAVYSEEKPSKKREGDNISKETRRLIRHLTTRYVFRFNTVMGYTEYRPNNTWVQDWEPCDENVINGMTIEARLSGLDVNYNDVRRFTQSKMIRQHDPIYDYLSKAADKWDGETDHIAMLARTVSCDIPQWEQWFKKWFVSMVAQWRNGRQDYGNSIVPLLISSQGDGKTTFCRNLLPKELRWGFLETLDVSEKRQTLQAMHNFLLINLDEFNSISPKLQEGFLKNVIQLPSVKIKRPYGKHVEEFKRYASFIATTNDVSVLSDPTGSRRFICVHLTAPIDTSYKPNYEGLYGQACTLASDNKAKWYFDANEVKEIMAHNKQYQILPPAIQYFSEYFEVVDNEDDGEWMSVTAIYQALRKHAGSSLKVSGVNRFGRVLSNIEGIQKKRTNVGYKYLVREK